MPRVYICTLGGRALYYYFRLLKGTNIQFKAIVPGEHTERGSVCLTTREEAGDACNTLFYEDLTKDVLVDRVILYSKILHNSEAVVGIDPGKTIGVAITVNGMPVSVLAISDIKRLHELISMLQARLKSIYIKVGNGDIHIYPEIIKELSSCIRNTDYLVVVNEKNTTPKGRAGHKKDINAALKIAMRNS